MQRVPLPDSLAEVITVHRIDLSLEVDPLEELAQLTPDETERAGRFIQLGDRVRFVVTRAATRRLLAHHLGCSPAQVDISIGRHGKPMIRLPVRGARPSFNVAHSGSYALIVISDESRVPEVGVDIERCNRNADVLEVADIAFTPEERVCIRAAADPLAALYSHWVAKEAVLKAAGVGIPEHLQSVWVSPGPEASVTVNTRVLEWTTLQAMALPAPCGYAAALAWRTEKLT